MSVVERQPIHFPCAEQLGAIIACTKDFDGIIDQHNVSGRITVLSEK